MKLWIVLFCLLVAHPAFAAETTMTRSSQKGFFSVGAQYMLGGNRLLNTDSGYATYKNKGYGLDLDILLWDSGGGDIRLFGSHSQTTGELSGNTSNKMESSETVAGIKFFTGSNLYLAGGLGNGSTKLKNTGSTATLSYQMVKALLGLEFQLSESWFIGLELSYRSAPIKKDGNSSLTENSYIEGMGAGLRLVWSPPSVTYSPSSK